MGNGLGVGAGAYWNSYVAATRMPAQGSFFEPLLWLDVQARPDRVTSQLDVLLRYQLTLETPPPPQG